MLSWVRLMARGGVVTLPEVLPVQYKTLRARFIAIDKNVLIGSRSPEFYNRALAEGLTGAWVMLCQGSRRRGLMGGAPALPVMLGVMIAMGCCKNARDGCNTREIPEEVCHMAIMPEGSQVVQVFSISGHAGGPGG